MTFPEPEIPNPEKVVIEWQADRLMQLANENGRLKAQLRYISELVLSVTSDTTPAGMGSEQEAVLRKMCSEIVGAKG